MLGKADGCPGREGVAVLRSLQPLRPRKTSRRDGRPRGGSSCGEIGCIHGGGRARPAPSVAPSPITQFLGAAGPELSLRGLNLPHGRRNETAGGAKRKRVPAGEQRGREPRTKRPGPGRPWGGRGGCPHPELGPGRSPPRAAWGRRSSVLRGDRRGRIHGPVLRDSTRANSWRGARFVVLVSFFFLSSQKANN